MKERVTFEELKRAFKDVCTYIYSMPCGFEDVAGEYAAEIADRLYEEEIDDRKKDKQS